MLSGKSGLLDTVEKCVKVTQVCLSVCVSVSLCLCQLVCMFVKYCLRMIESLLYRVAGCLLFRGCLSIEVNGRTVRKVCSLYS